MINNKKNKRGFPDPETRGSTKPETVAGPDTLTSDTQDRRPNQADLKIHRLSKGYTDKQDHSITSFAELAAELYKKGLEPIPVTPGEKFWRRKGWQSIKLPVTPWPPGHGISIRTGRTCLGVDIDVLAQDVVSSLLDWIQVDCLTRIGQAPKVLIPLVCPEIDKKMFSDSYADQHGEINRIEILSTGNQFVAYAIHPGTGTWYQWSGDLLRHSLPIVPKSFILDLISKFHSLADAEGWTNVSQAESKAEQGVRRRRKSPVKGEGPAAVYNKYVSLSDILIHYGWKHYQGNRWTRPGKRTGVSASVFDERILYPFTSSTILTPEQCYDAFEIVAQYDFGGDKSALARALIKEVGE